MTQPIDQYGSTPGKSTTVPAASLLQDFDALEQLAQFLYLLPPDRFSFDQVVSKWETEYKCGTVCCAIGWLPTVLPDRCRWGGTYEWPTAQDPRVVITTHRGSSFKDWAMKIFRIPNRSYASKLFCPGELLPWFHLNQKESVTIGLPVDSCTSTADLVVPETPKNVAASIRAYIQWSQDGMPIDPYTVLEGARRKR